MEQSRRAEIEEQEFLLSSINREIRISLNGIKGYLYLMRESMEDREQLEGCVTQLELSAAQLEGTMQDIFECSVQEKSILQDGSEENWSRETLKGRKILLADSDGIYREILARILKRNGAVVEAVSSGREVLRIFDDYEDQSFDCIFFNTRLMDMNGIELAKLIDKERIKVRIFAFSSQVDGEVLEEARRAGVEMVFEKPLDIMNVLDKICQCA